MNLHFFLLKYQKVSPINHFWLRKVLSWRDWITVWVFWLDITCPVAEASFLLNWPWFFLMMLMFWSKRFNVHSFFQRLFTVNSDLKFQKMYLKWKNECKYYCLEVQYKTRVQVVLRTIILVGHWQSLIKAA